MVLILIALSGASVWAAPNGQDLISGIVEDIEVDEETNTVLVTLALVDETGEPTGETQRVRMSLAKAQELGLVDGDGNPSYPSDPITITLGDDVQVIEEVLHPVALALAKVFDGLLGLEEGEIMGYHEDGFGFGVIAKACWMAYALEGDATLLGDILAAKKSGDFSSITLPEGGTAKNWGQFKKAVLTSDKAKKNLGAIMSGRVKPTDETDGDLGASSNLGQGKGKKGKGPGEDGPPGKSKKGSQGGGPPAEPPGKVKNKDKGKGGGKKK